MKLDNPQHSDKIGTSSPRICRTVLQDSRNGLEAGGLGVWGFRVLGFRNNSFTGPPDFPLLRAASLAVNAALKKSGTFATLPHLAQLLAATCILAARCNLGPPPLADTAKLGDTYEESGFSHATPSLRT